MYCRWCSCQHFLRMSLLGILFFCLLCWPFLLLSESNPISHEILRLPLFLSSIDADIWLQFQALTFFPLLPFCWGDYSRLSVFGLPETKILQAAWVLLMLSPFLNLISNYLSHCHIVAIPSDAGLFTRIAFQNLIPESKWVMPWEDGEREKKI